MHTSRLTPVKYGPSLHYILVKLQKEIIITNPRIYLSCQNNYVKHGVSFYISVQVFIKNIYCTYRHIIQFNRSDQFFTALNYMSMSHGFIL